MIEGSCLVIEANKVLMLNPVWASSSGGACDGAKGTVHMSFQLSLLVASTRALMMELPPMQQ